MVPEIKTMEEKELIIKNHKVVLIKCYADWCTPCQMLEPLFAELYKKYNLEGSDRKSNIYKNQ